MSIDENVTTTPEVGQKRPSALELGPRKKACVPAQIPPFPNVYIFCFVQMLYGSPCASRAPFWPHCVRVVQLPGIIEQRHYAHGRASRQAFRIPLSRVRQFPFHFDILTDSLAQGTA